MNHRLIKYRDPRIIIDKLNEIGDSKIVISPHTILCSHHFWTKKFWCGEVMFYLGLTSEHTTWCLSYWLVTKKIMPSTMMDDRTIDKFFKKHPTVESFRAELEAAVAIQAALGETSS